MDSLFIFDRYSYRYRRTGEPVLQDISFSVRRGEITAVVGRSGSGKSTLAHVMSGVIPKVITSGSSTGRAERQGDIFVGFVTQMPESQLFGYTVEDAVAFGLENQNIPREDIEKRLADVLALLHISHLRHRVVERLSGGQKQAVCIASVLIMQPDLLILDEPVSSLDPLGKSMVQEILVSLKEAGQSVVILDQFLDWCAGGVDRVIGLEQGRVVFEGSLGDFLSDQRRYEALGVTVPACAVLSHRLQDSGFSVPLAWRVEAMARTLSGKVLWKPAEQTEEDMSGKDIVLEARHLRHCYGDFEALSDVNASFRKGTVTAILGQNGSGKTTFVHHLNGLLAPTGGEILYQGASIDGKSVAEMSRHVALIFQHPDQMLFEDTVHEEIQFSRRMHGSTLSDSETKALLTEAGMEQAAEEFPLNLSMGQKHMVTILGAAASGAEVVVFDEPTLGMDLAMKRCLVQLIRRLRGAGVCVILISHELSFVCEVSDQVLLLHDGRIAYSGSMREAFDQRSLLADMKMPLPDMEVLSDALQFKEAALTVDDFVNHAVLVDKEVP